MVTCSRKEPWSYSPAPLHSGAVLISFLLLLAGCVSHDRISSKPHAAAIPRDARIQTADDAIAVIRRATKSRGCDPNASEYHANRSGKDWFVTAWHIWYPNNTGSSRFVPGGYTAYTVSHDGKILATMPGL